MATTFTVSQLQSIHDRFISTDGAVNLPVEVRQLIDGDAARKSVWGGWKVHRVVDFTSALAGVCILLGREEEAERVMRTGFELVNGVEIYKSNLEDYGGCMCDIAQRIGTIANCLGLPRVTAYVRCMLRCPKSPPGYRPEIPDREVSPEEARKSAQSWTEDFQVKGKWPWPV